MNYCSKKILDLLVERQHKDHHKDSTYRFPIFLADLPLIKKKKHHLQQTLEVETVSAEDTPGLKNIPIWLVVFNHLETY